MHFFKRENKNKLGIFHSKIREFLKEKNVNGYGSIFRINFSKNSMFLKDLIIFLLLKKITLN